MTVPHVFEDERCHEKRSFFAQGGRLLRSLPSVGIIAPLYLSIVAAAAAGPILFRSVVGQVSECSSSPCHIELLGILLPAAGALWCVFSASFLLRTTGWLIAEVGGKIGTLKMYRAALDGLGATRVTYFDENPSGRIRKRLTEDFMRVRLYAVMHLGDLTNAFADLLATVVLVSFSSPLALLTVPPVVIALALVQKRDVAALHAARTRKSHASGRVAQVTNDAVEGQPVFSLYDRSGSVLRRMHEAYDELIRRSIDATELHARNAFWTVCIGEIYAACLSVAVVVLIASGTLSAVGAGVMISAIIGTSQTCRWLTFLASFLSVDFAASERLLEYAELPREEDEERETMPARGGRIGGGTETEGIAISFREFSMSYRPELPTILHSIDLEIPAGSRIALMGRSGCGKSSIVQALLRMVYVREGDIRFDGNSIYGRPAEEIRNRISLVPQFPHLFPGTLRDNLDRTGHYSVGEIDAALDLVGLSFRSSSPIVEGGTNLSMGERQLISLARAVLRRTPILVMDAPTSMIDEETDRRIQDVIRRSFNGTTILTIAHRHHTVGDYDRAVLLDAGVIVATGTPDEIRRRAKGGLRESLGMDGGRAA
jgi:ATP-binding cassette, subfamily C (CFTR/MRP), member 1